MTLDVVQLLVFILNPKFPWGDSVQSFLDQIKNLQLQVRAGSTGTADSSSRQAGRLPQRTSAARDHTTPAAI